MLRKDDDTCFAYRRLHAAVGLLPMPPCLATMPAHAALCAFPRLQPAHAATLPVLPPMLQVGLHPKGRSLPLGCQGTAGGAAAPCDLTRLRLGTPMAGQCGLCAVFFAAAEACACAGCVYKHAGSPPAAHHSAGPWCHAGLCCLFELQGFQGEFLWAGTSDSTAVMAVPTGAARLLTAAQSHIALPLLSCKNILTALDCGGRKIAADYPAVCMLLIGSDSRLPCTMCIHRTACI